MANPSDYFGPFFGLSSEQLRAIHEQLCTAPMHESKGFDWLIKPIPPLPEPEPIHTVITETMTRDEAAADGE